MQFPILALVSEPAPAGRSSSLGIAIILLCLVIACSLAARAAVRHFKGVGGCCGGGSSEPPPDDEKKLDSVVARRELDISGMLCANCVGRVKKALDAIPGVAADVSLDPQRAFVKMDRAVPDETLRAAVEGLGFAVTAVR